MTERTRLWDKDFNLLYDSNADRRTVREFLDDEHLDEVNFTTDHDPSWKTRRAGKIVRGGKDDLTYDDNREFLNHMLFTEDWWFGDVDDRSTLPVIAQGSRVSFERDGVIFTDVVTSVDSDPTTGECLIKCERTSKAVQKISDYVDRLIR
jgi:hypothetical protein